MEKSREVSKEEDRDVVFLSDSPREGVAGTGWANTEVQLGGGVLYCSLSFSELARFRCPLSGDGMPPEKLASAPPNMELCLFGTGIALEVWCLSLEDKQKREVNSQL